MEKILKPKENYNTHKLSVELKNAEIENCIWIYDDHLKIEFEPTVKDEVEQIIFSHTPEPIPEKDRYFSVRLENDVLAKARHNIAYNAKNKVGGGVRY